MMRILILLVGLTMIVSCSDEKVRIHLIPEGYQGALVFIEDQNSTQQLEVKGDSLIFDFTKSNILRINGEFIEGSTSLSNIKYYYVDDSGSRSDIPIALGWYTKKDSSTIYLHLKHTQLNKGSKCDLICSPKMFNKYLHEQMELCDSLFAIRP
jgi:hypothetical protein